MRSSSNSYVYLRHPLAVRIMHWINVIAVSVLLMSGLQIFNAHPALYWGQSSYSGRPPVLQIGSTQASDGTPIGVTRVLGQDFKYDWSARDFGQRSDGPRFPQLGNDSWSAVVGHGPTMALLLCVGVLR